MCCNSTLAAKTTKVAPRIQKRTRLRVSYEVTEIILKTWVIANYRYICHLNFVEIPHFCMEHGVEEDCLACILDPAKKKLI
jgi:hypothetical protein